MQLQITDGYITGYATLGGFVDGIEAPDTALEGCDELALNRGCYLWDGEKAVLDEDKLDELQTEELKEEIRARREVECFSIINRGSLWYTRLSEEQVEELEVWYQEWLDAPDTKIIPEKPEWLR